MPATVGDQPRHGRLWLLFGATLLAAFCIVGFFGRADWLHREATALLDLWSQRQGASAAERRRALTAFFFWTSGAATTVRPGQAVTDTIEQGLWFARSADFLQPPLIETLRWMRMIGDTIFLIGVAAFAWFMAGLLTGWSDTTAPRRHEVPADAAHRTV